MKEQLHIQEVLKPELSNNDNKELQCMHKKASLSPIMMVQLTNASHFSKALHM